MAKANTIIVQKMFSEKNAVGQQLLCHSGEESTNGANLHI